MHRSPFVLGLAAVFAGLTTVLLIGAVVSGHFLPVFVAIPIAATSYFMYYHGSGKLARTILRGEAARRRRAERAGAGPRSRTGPRTRADREARAAAGVGRGSAGSRSGGSTAGRRPSGPANGPTRAEARDVLDVDVTADAAEIKRAYREKVKEVHPDRGGDEEAFKRVTAAYDRLRG